ncbi:protein arginine N-methyltransferase 7 isoform X2 [Ixodes scapularis]|uniref:protein arginine N-methyltransferase 7 isoform X2 n=1 Tax=Ixodes scapularis TaxID=6945 RepID=UPI001A9EEA4E|nr:protein arginine N-methyltransferase 7 isoform X2 [Ixodes scapularis]
MTKFSASPLNPATMNVFTSHFNPITGRNEWELRPEEYDYHQEIARSSFADMLHDWERNSKYHSALREAMDNVRNRGERVKVLDIGTGSGLLAMMAANYGAYSVHACEAFAPVAQRARQVIKDNGFGDKICLISKRSTDIEVGPGKDMPEKANILVTEVFDTELIGEGAIETFTHALRELLEPDALVVPHAATIYAQAVHSPFLRSFHTVGAVSVTGEQTVLVPKGVQDCAGVPAVHDLQLSQLEESDFIPLTPPLPVFRFNFTDPLTLAPKAHTVVETTAAESGTCHAILMWWKLDMDPGAKIELSCAPYWAHSSGKSAPWRDHWMQGVYYPPKTIQVETGQQFQLLACRDQYSLWFSVSHWKAPEPAESPLCNCGLHMSLSRTRIGMLNDDTRNRAYASVLQKVVTKESVCLCLGTGSLIPFMAAKLGAKKVYVIEGDTILHALVTEYMTCNQLQGVSVLEKEPLHLAEDDLDERANLLLSEPFFSTSLLPWHNLQFWFLRPEIEHLLTPGAITLPGTAVFYGLAVEFEHLWKIRAPVREAEGFDLSAFDELIQNAQAVSDEMVEPQPLWEYPCTAMTHPFHIATVNLASNLKSAATSGHVCFESTGNCNGVALWMDFVFDEDNTVTTGPTKKVVLGKKVTWDRFSRQGVYLFDKRSLQHCKDSGTILKWTFELDQQSGSVQYTFKIEPVAT